jgi:chromosome segregation ATPase
MAKSSQDKSAPQKRAVAAESPAAAIKRLEAENARLVKDLQTAEARVAELERQRDSALDRIEWVIDSLHSLREEHG